jgi:hypothetical protein
MPVPPKIESDPALGVAVPLDVGTVVTPLEEPVLAIVIVPGPLVTVILAPAVIVPKTGFAPVEPIGICPLVAAPKETIRPVVTSALSMPPVVEILLDIRLISPVPLGRRVIGPLVEGSIEKLGVVVSGVTFACGAVAILNILLPEASVESIPIAVLPIVGPAPFCVSMYTYGVVPSLSKPIRGIVSPF